MIVPDTNVVSEMLRPAPAPQVETWLATQECACVATRNTNDFAGCGIAVINPWEQASAR